MSQVFISYRQTDDEQKQCVRAFGERLRSSGIDVVLDQFFLDAKPGGPNETWAKWSSDRALETEHVLIIGTHLWFQCFEKKQPPGTGLGAACEADDIRQRIYEANGVIEHIRVVKAKRTKRCLMRAAQQRSTFGSTHHASPPLAISSPSVRARPFNGTCILNCLEPLY